MYLFSRWIRVGRGDLHLFIRCPPAFSFSVYFGVAILRYEAELSILWFGISYNWERER